MSVEALKSLTDDDGDETRGGVFFGVASLPSHKRRVYEKVLTEVA